MDTIFIIIIFSLYYVLRPLGFETHFLMIPMIIWVWLINKKLKKLEQKFLSFKNAPQPIPQENKDEIAPPVEINIDPQPIIEKIELEQAEVKSDNINFEQKWGARLPVWIGAISIALAGFFLVKYSIENELLSPEMRTIFGGLFGIALLHSSQKIRSKPEINNNIRIAQGLAGAGIIDLYVSIYAASNIYNLLPPVLGFIGMAIVTAIAIIHSLIHGYQIAILGLLGGFVTPMLFKSNDPSAPLLFSYLYFLIGGALWIIRKNNWWFLYIPLIIGQFLWVITWLISPYQPSDSYSITLFLMAVSGTIIYSINRKIKEGNHLFKRNLIPSYLSLGGTIILASVATVKSQFGIGEWALLWLISAASLVLAYFNQRQYGLLPWIALGLNMLMLALWPTSYIFEVKLVISAFCVLFCLGSGYLSYYSNSKLYWSRIAVSSSIIYYLLGYYRLAERLIEDHDSWLYSLPLWGMVALAIAYLSLVAVDKILRYDYLEEPVKQKLLTIFALNVTFFLSIAVTIELAGYFLPIALATEILAISWINNRVNIKSLPKLAECLGLLYCCIIAFDIYELISMVVFVPAKNYWLQIDQPLITVLLPSLIILGSTILFRKNEQGKTAYYFEFYSSLLLGISSIALAESLIACLEDKFSLKLILVKHSASSCLLLVYCLAYLWIWRKYNREAFKYAGRIFMWLALFKILFYHLYIENPLLVRNPVGEMFIFNYLLLIYLAPALLLFFIQKELLAITGFAKEIKINNYLRGCPR